MKLPKSTWKVSLKASDVLEVMGGIAFLIITYFVVQYVTIAYFTAWYTDDRKPDFARAWENMKCHYELSENCDGFLD